MAVRFRVFASGKLKGTGAYYTLYPVPIGKSVIVNAMRFTNATSGATPATFTIALKRPHFTETILFPDGRGLPLGAYKMAVEDREIPLGAGEEIRAKVDQAYHNQIHFIICGIERDA